jgi:hypothetical protein
MDSTLGRIMEVGVARDGWGSIACETAAMCNHPCRCSESSLFVFDNYLILKTCGTTTLLNAVPTIARLARTVCNRQEVAEVFYSRKEFMNPGEQHYPHTSFQDEVRPRLNGSVSGCAVYVKNNANGWLRTLAFHPHSHFRTCPQVKYLDKHFDGAAYALGRLNGDMWYVYLMDKPQAIKADPCQTIGVWLWLARPCT